MRIARKAAFYVLLPIMLFTIGITPADFIGCDDNPDPTGEVLWASLTPVELIASTNDWAVGGTVSVKLDVSHVYNFGKFRCSLLYDPEMLEVTEVYDGLVGESVVDVSHIERVNGVLKLTGNTTEAVSGGGYLTEIEFKCLSEGSTIIRFRGTDNVLVSWYGYETQSEWNDLEIRIGRVPDISVYHMNIRGSLVAGMTTPITLYVLNLGDRSKGADIKVTVSLPGEPDVVYDLVFPKGKYWHIFKGLYYTPTVDHNVAQVTTARYQQGTELRVEGD